MRILIVGSGGREHALAWKASQSSHVERIYVAPGNAGTSTENKTENVAIGSSDIAGLLQFAKQHHIDLTLVGPEGPLANGIVDLFQKEKLRCLGPTKAAAQLESSKYFSKQFMTRFNIPTADYAAFTDIDAAIAYISNRPSDMKLVIKADGLAAGKGVVIAANKKEAIAAAEDMLIGKIFGQAGHRVIVEEFLEGEEASFIALVDGEHVLPLASSQDHKTRDDHDRGPNTGGMGAYSPAVNVTESMQARIMSEIITPTVMGMKKLGHPYLGFLYAGVMISPDGTPKVLEYNCRLGDPETQPIMMRLKTDLIDLCLHALDKKLDQVTIDWDTRPALGVVLTAGGYPNQYRKGDIIHGLVPDTNANTKVFHAGTAEKNGHIVTSGGRVLCVTALGSDIKEAQKRAYEMAAPIVWENMYYRTDIGHRAIKSLS